MAAAAYIDGRLGISTDIKTWQHEKEWGNRLGARIRELGDTVTLYALFDRVDERVEALWFEGKTWTYGELKRGEYCVEMGWDEDEDEC